jgi:hypothetical protein
MVANCGAGLPRATRMNRRMDVQAHIDIGRVRYLPGRVLRKKSTIAWANSIGASCGSQCDASTRWSVA